MIYGLSRFLPQRHEGHKGYTMPFVLFVVKKRGKMKNTEVKLMQDFSRCATPKAFNMNNPEQAEGAARGCGSVSSELRSSSIIH
jgi:hypothetical protein